LGLLRLLAYFPTVILEIGGSSAAWGNINPDYDEIVAEFCGLATGLGIFAFSSAPFLEGWMKGNPHWSKFDGGRGKPDQWVQDTWHVLYSAKSMNELCAYQSDPVELALCMSFDPAWRYSQVGALKDVRDMIPVNYDMNKNLKVSREQLQRFMKPRLIKVQPKVEPKVEPKIEAKDEGTMTDLPADSSGFLPERLAGLLLPMMMTRRSST
jgi:hypothetical protein